ncbi:MAG: ATP-binding protein [Candidatus Woesearchaeota archaeon]
MISLKELKKLGTRTLPTSQYRPTYTEKITTWLNKKEIIIIKGIRRSGKSHIMYQLIQNLPKDTVYYFNFEDYKFGNQRDITLLENIIELRDKTKKTYFFFDEIQQIHGFERWLRTWYDKELPIKFIISGSNISLLAPQLATILTGRNITYTIKPLSWKEAKDFTPLSFEDYLVYGGFPEILLEHDTQRKKEQLQQYLKDIIAKDILFKHNIQNPKLIESLLYFFITNPGTKISANKLGSQLHIAKETAQKYLEAVKDTFLLFEVPYFSWSTKTKYIGNRASKYYVIDNGFLTAVSLKKNTSALYENLVAIALHDKEIVEQLFYWQNGVEIDFITKQKAIQVTANNQIPQREIDAFKVFNEKHKNFAHIIITPNNTHNSISLQKFLETIM